MSYITVNKQNFAHNIEFLSQKAGGIEKIMAVLKDNAYGHDLVTMAKLCVGLKIKKAAVKNLQEALLIQEYFDEILVLVDHPPKKEIPQNISIAVHTIKALKEVLPHTSIHLSLDTGMHRNGLRAFEYEEALQILQDRKLILKGIFTHFRSADEVNGEYFWQEKNYLEAKNTLKALIEKYNLPQPAYHSCNSAALLRQETSLDDDYARCGIAMYGYIGLPKSFATYDLKPVMSLWAQKLSSRILEKGQRIGYGGAYEAKEDELISTYDIGYGDGFFRFGGTKEFALDSEHILVGKVSMDSLFIKGEEEEVCLFEDATHLANEFHTIVYEILAKLSPTLHHKVI